MIQTRDEGLHYDERLSSLATGSDDFVMKIYDCVAVSPRDVTQEINIHVLSNLPKDNHRTLLTRFNP